MCRTYKFLESNLVFTFGGIELWIGGALDRGS